MSRTVQRKGLEPRHSRGHLERGRIIRHRDFSLFLVVAAVAVVGLVASSRCSLRCHCLYFLCRRCHHRRRRKARSMGWCLREDGIRSKPPFPGSDSGLSGRGAVDSARVGGRTVACAAPQVRTSCEISPLLVTVTEKKLTYLSFTSR